MEERFVGKALLLSVKGRLFKFAMLLPITSVPSLHSKRKNQMRTVVSLVAALLTWLSFQDALQPKTSLLDRR